MALLKNVVLEAFPGKIQTALQCFCEFTFFQIPHQNSALRLIGFSEKSKMESFRDATSEETCFSLYLGKKSIPAKGKKIQ